MRINETKVIQLIESNPAKLVIVDDVTGIEILVYAGELPGLRARMDEVEGYGVAGAEMVINDEGDMIAFTTNDFPAVRYALDYFGPHL